MSMIGKRVGNYEIKSKLGEGGMGAVYLGEHPLIGKKVAIKVLLEEFASNEQVVTRFFNEAKAVNDIGHQNIVDIIDFGKTPSEDGQSEMVYFVMELLSGESLADRIKRQPLSTEETRHVIVQCCDALFASHQKGIVHRDLKPDNIYLTRRGSDVNFVKILDFGIAKLTGAGGASSKTQTGVVIGTPYYMSPEQCAGRGQIDHRSDIYSLGCLLYELITGVLPFPGEGFGDILVAHLTRDPPKPTEVKADAPKDLEAAVIKSMAKNREQRYQTMEEFGGAVAGKAVVSSGDFKFQPLFTDDLSQKINLQEANKAGFNTLDKKKETDDKKITTLSGAASEMAGGGRKAGSAIAVAVVVLAIAGVGGFFALRGGSSGKDANTTPPPAVVVTPPAPPAVVEIKITSTPAGAMVVRADQAEGPRLTPALFKLHKGDAPFEVQVKLEGYKPQIRTISAEQTMTLDVTLARDENAPQPLQPSTPPTTPLKKKKRVEQPAEDDMKTLAPVFN
jgi:eukaryotic-like serine/threonine-protein kinase